MDKFIVRQKYLEAIKPYIGQQNTGNQGV